MSAGWDDLVATALLGTARRPLDLDALPEPLRRSTSDAEDPAVRLLDTAAALTAWRRAGASRTVPVPAAPIPAADDPHPAAPVDLLRDLLRAKDTALLVEWLTVAAANGFVAPHEALPALLDAGAGNRALSASVAAVLGTRGRWLAAQRPTWLPQAARADLGPADDTGLDPTDEPELERALTHRSRATRDAAAALLARLPGSGYSDRMVARARDCVRFVPGRGLQVRPPRGIDDAMVRDAIVAGGTHEDVRTGGVRAWWLRQIVAATPLTFWTDLVGGTPAQLPAMPVSDGWAPVLLEGWAEATVRQQDPQWAAALVPHRRTGRAELLALVPERDRAALVVAQIRSGEGDAAHATAVLRDCPRPWTPDLGTAALADTFGRTWPAASSLPCKDRFDLLGHALPPTMAGHVEEFAARPGLSDAARAFALRALDVLTVRRRIHTDLVPATELPPAEGPTP